MEVYRTKWWIFQPAARLKQTRGVPTFVEPRGTPGRVPRLAPRWHGMVVIRTNTWRSRPLESQDIPGGIGTPSHSSYGATR